LGTEWNTEGDGVNGVASGWGPGKAEKENGQLEKTTKGAGAATAFLPFSLPEAV
jgi:hypothetical protein